MRCRSQGTELLGRLGTSSEVCQVGRRVHTEFGPKSVSGGSEIGVTQEDDEF